MRRARHFHFSALARFVHQRIGISEGFGSSAAAAQELASNDLSSLTQAVRESRPVILKHNDANGFIPLELLGGPTGSSKDLLPRLRALCGHRKVSVRLPTANSGHAAGDALTFGDAAADSPYKKVEQWRFDAVVDELLASSSSASSGSRPAKIYAANLSLEAALPEIASCFHPVSAKVASLSPGTFGPVIPGTPVLYLGAGGQRTPLHFDPTENLTAVLQGQKTLRLFPPSSSEHLRPRGGRFAAAVCWVGGVVPAVYSAVDAWADEGSSLGPDKGCSRPIDIVLTTGDIVYLPAGWWHAVAGSNEPNITLVFGYAPSPAKGAQLYRRWLPF